MIFKMYTVVVLGLSISFFIKSSTCLPQNAIEGILPKGIKDYFEVKDERRPTIEDLLAGTLESKEGKTVRKKPEKLEIKQEDSKLDKVLSHLEDLQLEIKDLKDKLTTLQEEVSNGNNTKEKCKRGQGRKGEREFRVLYCGNETVSRRNFFYVDATYGKWDKEAFCRVFHRGSIDTIYYRISAKFFNLDGPEGLHSGFPGIAFNIQDQNNFDFIYLRLHRSLSCFRTGFMQKGLIKWTGSRTGVCPEGPPKGRTWFRLEVLVRDTEAEVRLNNVKVTDFKPHFPPSGRGGVIAAAGQGNRLRFKGFNVTEIQPFPFSFHSCLSHSHLGTGYFILDARHGDWPEDGFCRAISKSVIPDENYALSVALYNQRAYMGVDSGVIGVIFNVQDYYNFDFLYMRPHSVGGCYTTGFVQNGGIRWVNSQIGSCPGGPPKGGKWFNVTVYVRQNQVTMTFDSKHLASAQSHFPSTGRGGVIVANGLQNIASFRDFKVFPIEPLSFDFIDCTHKSRNSQFYYILDASHGDWPKDTFCRAVHKTTVPGQHYVISVKLFNQGPWRGEGSNYAGLLFNAKDNFNYDFIYFKPHAKASCFQSGYVLNGKIQWVGSKDGFCANGPPKMGTWFQLEITVREGLVMVELDGKHIVLYKAHFPTYGRGGVIVGNGHRNVLTFREYSCYATKSLPFIIRSCGEGTHRTNGSFVLDASLEKIAGHCRALSRRFLKVLPSATKYAVEAKIYNIKSWHGPDWGTVGLMFNVMDDNNYDYIVLNLHSKDYCYQFGSVMNGVSTKSKLDFGVCPFGPPKRGGWFSMRIEVLNREKVALLLNERQIAKASYNLPWKAKAGIVVDNGYRNVIMFREFLLRYIE